MAPAEWVCAYTIQLTFKKKKIECDGPACCRKLQERRTMAEEGFSQNQKKTTKKMRN